jgi:hypothetical protein
MKKLGLTFPHFEFQTCILILLVKSKVISPKIKVFAPTMQIQGFKLPMGKMSV